jgi:hypothetical protein
MPEALVIGAGVFVLLALLFIIAAVVAVKKRQAFGTVLSVALALLMLALAGLLGTLRLSVQGYRALTREESAAKVKVQPTGAQEFSARFILPDGREELFSLAGDQLYVDARILKWKPVVNLFGLHTAYELDRVSGRYEELEDERTKAHTAFSLSEPKWLDLFQLRLKFKFLEPLVDAEYGSGTFISARQPAEFDLMVSTTGLLLRKE